LAGTDLDAVELFADRIAAKVSSLLWDDFKIECPTGSKRFLTINQVADELACRLSRIFLKGKDGERPVLKYHQKLAKDPHFKDYILFHEYFHGDTGRGVGASHQTGWTGLIAKLLQPRSFSSDTEFRARNSPITRNLRSQPPVTSI
jgi:hypothetical protein